MDLIWRLGDVQDRPVSEPAAEVEPLRSAPHRTRARTHVQALRTEAHAVPCRRGAPWSGG